MRYVNGVLGYVLVVLGLLLAVGEEASPGGAVAIAGAVLIAGERLCDHLRQRRGTDDGNG